VCDEEIQGSTAEEMMEKGKNHVHSKDDEGHQGIVKGMENATPEEIEAWKKDLVAKYEAAPEVQ
jgi:hypothetical protein